MHASITNKMELERKAASGIDGFLVMYETRDTVHGGDSHWFPFLAAGCCFSLNLDNGDLYIMLGRTIST